MAAQAARAAETRGEPDQLRPETLPDLFASTCQGTCLEPIYNDGDCLVFSKTEPIVAGDFVCVWFQPGVVAAGQHPRWVKRLAMGLPEGTSFPFKVAPSSNCEPLVVLEMLNPPKRFIFPASKIAAMFKVVGKAVSTGDGRAAWHPPERFRAAE